MSLGVMSTGIGDVPATQTYLDISQGNRVSETLYDRPIPPTDDLLPLTDLFLKVVPDWGRLLERADSAPAEIQPGLLATTLQAAHVPARVERRVEDPAVMVANHAGRVRWLRPRYLPCRRQLCKGVTLLGETLHNTRKLVGRLRGGDLLIALPEARGERTVPIGIAGEGFHGDLTSDSTRTDGYVLSTDIAPTVLRRIGLAIPDAMDGEPIRAEGDADPAAVQDLADRMAAIPDRRGPVLIVCLLAWIAAGAVLAALGARRTGAAWVGLAIAYLPLMLLAGAALEPGAAVEGLIVGVGAALLAAVTLRLLPGWHALALACAISAIAYGVDVIAGSGLTRLSLLGPNPIYGVRFYGIGNEMEALLAVMVPVGVGAGLTAAREGRRVQRRVDVAAFLVAGGLACVIFGAGRFGADVGAAIVLPVGAAVAAGALPTSGLIRAPSRRDLLAALVLTPFIALVFLSLIDLISGGNAHLSRSVLDAGGAGDLADVAQRRLELSAHDFSQTAGNPLFWLVVAGLGVAIWQWQRIDAWLRPAPAVRAGVFGACAAVAVGVLVNDSGASFLVLGACALGAAVAYAWSQV
jgi:hypothetical protein